MADVKKLSERAYLDGRVQWWMTDCRYRAPEELTWRYVLGCCQDLTRDGAVGIDGEASVEVDQAFVDGVLAALGGDDVDAVLTACALKRPEG